MASRSRAPRTHPVVGADEVVARKYGIVAIGEALNQVSVHIRPPPIPAPVVSAKWVAEGAGRGREERGREWAWRALCKERDARVEAKRHLLEYGCVQPAILIQGRGAGPHWVGLRRVC